MSVAYRSLPSLQALRCFEAASRLGSFALAAEEMCITHSAISHQVRGLEESLGQSLFRRTGNRMVLTVAGNALAVETRRALDYLAQAYSTASVNSNPIRETVTIAIQFAITEHLILSRLNELQASLGGATLKIQSLGDLIETCPEEADIALVYGIGDIPGMITEKLSDEEVFPVCSPAFRDRHPDLSLDTLVRFPLLLHSRVTWNLWLEKARLPIDYPADACLLDDVALTVRGALAGQGIAMARSLLVRDYIRDGSLVRLFDLAVPGVFGYHIAWRSEQVRARFQPVKDLLQQMIASE